MTVDCFADFERADAVLRRALDLPTSKRRQYVERECATDPALRERVLDLIEGASDGPGAMAPGGALSGAIWAGLADTGFREASAAGTILWPWRVGEEIGRGGMAAVYRAERADGAFDQRVAVKILSVSRSSERLERRFARERAILSRLEHPNIARLLDGGTTPSGRPYLVMEYVDGEPIDRYCDRRRLTVEARLRLFLAVCAAVQAAHRQLVIHRDLKPSNILVTRDGTPKLLDFGIAKLLEPETVEADPTRTALFDRVLTPQYASPEQVVGEPMSTAADVYTLGLLLYELLTGRRAHHIDSSRPSAIEHAICEEAPTAPSAAVRGGARQPDRDDEILATTLSGARRLATRALRRRLRGDLDNIVLKALRREPGRRYDSAEQLGEDIRRHLESRPVKARPDRLGYRARKFVRRHSVGVATAVGVVLLTASLTGLYTERLARERDRSAQLAEEAELEAARANEVADFLVELFQSADPYQRNEAEPTVRDLVEHAARRIDAEIANEPLLRARLLATLGQVFSNLADYDQAQELMERSVTLRGEALGDDHPDTLDSRRRQAQLIYRRGDFELARSVLEQVLETQERTLGPRHRDVIDTLNDLGNLYKRIGELDLARTQFERALDIAHARLGPEHLMSGHILNNLGLLLIRQWKFEEARDALRQTVSMYERHLGADSVRLAEALGNLSHANDRLGRHEEQVDNCRRYLEVAKAALGPSHPTVATALICLGNGYRDTGRNREAIPVYREALEAYRNSVGPEHVYTAYPLANLGNAYRDAGEREQALVHYEQALAIWEKGGSKQLTASILEKLGRLRMQMGTFDHAERDLRRALSFRQELHPEGHWQLAKAQAALGRCLIRMDRLNEAERLLTASFTTLRDARGLEHEDVQDVATHLAALYQARGEPELEARYRGMVFQVGRQ